MLKRDFLTFREAVERVGDDKESLRQALLHRAINAYVELNDVDGTYDQFEEEEPKNGNTHFASWWKPFSFRDKKPDENDRGITYKLRGWFALEGPDIKRAARGGSTGHAWGTSLCPATDSGGEPFYSAGQLSFDVQISYELEELWFRTSDIERLIEPDPSEKPLDTRERATLLCIIGALATHGNLDLSQPMKAGETVAAMLPPDLRLSARTIGEHLKAVRNAIDSRKA